MSTRRKALALTVLLTTGCGSVYYGPPEHADTLIGTETRVVPGNTVAARASATGTALTVRAIRVCDHVEVQEYERVSTRQADEDLHAPLIALGIGTAPLASGAILLADAGAVYDNDRNSRLYNQGGPEGAIIGGVALLALSGLFIVPSVVNLVRYTGSQESTSVVERRGAVLEPGVRCAEEVPARGVDVVGRLAGGQRLHLGRTDDVGALQVDLSQRVSPAALAAAGGRDLEILVRDQRIAMVDLDPVAAAHREQGLAGDETAWREARPDACRAARTPEACAGVARYLRRHPQGGHASEASLLLDLAGAGVPPPDAEPPAILAQPPCEGEACP